MAITIKKNKLTNVLINKIFGNHTSGRGILDDDDDFYDTYDVDLIIEEFLVKKLGLVNIAFLKKYKYMPSFKLKEGQKIIASIYFFDTLSPVIKKIDYKETLSETGLLLERIELYLIKHMVNRDYALKKLDMFKTI